MGMRAYFSSQGAPLNRDPFDRIMVAQALAEGISLVAHNSAMHAYPHTIIV